MCTCAGSSRPKRSTSASLNNRLASSVNILVHFLALTSIAFIVLGPSVSTCIPIAEFFPFNTTSDRATERSDDGGSGQINLTVKFPFFGQHHDKLFVNNNGIITFIKGLRTYRPTKFPLAENTPIIAVYWADVDTQNVGGNVWYQEYKDPKILTKAQEEIRNYQFAYRNFRASWVFVATWGNVGFFGAKEGGVNKSVMTYNGSNTFQSVLVLDNTGSKSFVILNYGHIDWTTGVNSQGSPLTGLGGKPAQAGFNAGDTKNFYEIEGARTHAIVNLTQTSNVGIPGKWIFRIDSASIEEACSSSGHGDLVFWPSHVSMLGGGVISVNGPCFSDSLSIVGRIEETGHEFCCYAVTSIEAKCVMPPVFKTGVLSVSLNIGNRGWNFTGQLEFKNLMDMDQVLVRRDPDSWVPGRNVKVMWKDGVNVANASRYLVELLEYQVIDGVPKFHTLYSKYQSVIRNRRVAIKIPNSFDTNALAVVRVTFVVEECQNLGPYAYSDVFPIKPKTTQIAEGHCLDWLQTQSQLPPLQVTGQCPCTRGQGEGDTGQFVKDPLCNLDSDWSMNCKYRSPDAGECHLPNLGEDASASYACCYDKTSGELLNPLEGRGGGTTERYTLRASSSSSITPQSSSTPSNTQVVVPYFSYMQSDVAPFLYCCTYASNATLCDAYLQLRPPIGCQGYKTPACAQGSGDPHLDSLDGQSYTFNGVGEFTFLKVKDTNTEIQVRTSRAKDDNGKYQNATVFTGVVLRASNTSSVVEILHDSSEGSADFFTVLVDGRPFEISTTTSNFNGITMYAKKSAVDKNDNGNTAAVTATTTTKATTTSTVPAAPVAQSRPSATESLQTPFSSPLSLSPSSSASSSVSSSASLSPTPDEIANHTLSASHTNNDNSSVSLPSSDLNSHPTSNSLPPNIQSSPTTGSIRGNGGTDTTKSVNTPSTHINTRSSHLSTPQRSSTKTSRSSRLSTSQRSSTKTSRSSHPSTPQHSSIKTSHSPSTDKETSVTSSDLNINSNGFSSTEQTSTQGEVWLATSTATGMSGNDSNDDNYNKTVATTNDTSTFDSESGGTVNGSGADSMKTLFSTHFLSSGGETTFSNDSVSSANTTESSVSSANTTESSAVPSTPEILPVIDSFLDAIKPDSVDNSVTADTLTLSVSGDKGMTGAKNIENFGRRLASGSDVDNNVNNNKNNIENNDFSASSSSSSISNSITRRNHSTYLNNNYNYNSNNNNNNNGDKSYDSNNSNYGNSISNNNSYYNNGEVIGEVDENHDNQQQQETEDSDRKRRRRRRRQTSSSSGEASSDDSDSKREITLVADSMGLSILVEVTPDLLNVMVIAGPQLKGRVEGLMGNYNDDSTDDLVSKDGMTLTPSASMRDIHYQFGMSWEVTSNESLFTPASNFGNIDINGQIDIDGIQGSDPTDNAFAPIFLDELSAKKDGLRSNTVQICGDNVQCQFDYMVTGKESIAVSTLKFSNKFAERRKEIQPVVRCPYVHAVANGNRTLQGQKIGDKAYVVCYSGYVLTNGTDTMTCLDSGKWDQPTPACVEPIDTSKDDIPILVAVGSAVGGFLFLFFVCLVISCLCRRCKKSRVHKKPDSWSDFDQAIELPTIFPISDIPSPVFENAVFVSSLQKLSEKGTFRIPRPTFVDPNIYTEYF